MRQFIDEDEIALARQRRNDAEIGEIAGAEDERGLGAFEPREARFQFRKQRMIAGDEARRARPAP